jgi:hypothetical protein
VSRCKEPATPNDLLDQLLTGSSVSSAFDRGGLLDTLKKALTERALNADTDHHLARDGSAGNTRNGYGRKTVVTEAGKLVIDVPRGRESSFDPQLTPKYQRRFPGFDDKIVSMYARGIPQTPCRRIPSSRTSSTGCLRQVAWRPEESRVLRCFWLLTKAAIAREALLSPTGR